MYQCRYKTLRSLQHIEQGNRKNLVSVINNPEKVKRILNRLVGEKVIVLSQAVSLKDGTLLGEFRGGRLKDIEFYGNGKFSNANLWFNQEYFATRLNGVFDVMLSDSLVEGGKNPSFQDVRIFHFFDDAGDESKVLHVDPYLAYKALTDKDKRVCFVQRLLQVKKIRLGDYNTIFPNQSVHSDD